jgi:5-methylcytosine-specific restriction endonuclease McrA
MKDLLRDGWSVKGPRSYFHYSGPRVFLRGRTWTARKVTGELSKGHASAEAAIRWLVAQDPDYWTLGDRASCGMPLSSIFTETGFLHTDEHKDANKRDHVSILYLRKGRHFPSEAEASFKRLFLSRARCARCCSQSTDVLLRLLPNLRSMNKRTPYIVCECGYPVWRISQEAYDDAESRLSRWESYRENSKWRKDLLKISGGKHSASEIAGILACQSHRCIYCNRPFGDELGPTRDHLTPVCMGGEDWALNIVMCCRSCNTRRGTIPFRTYCKLLSPAQNRRIVRSLVLRIAEVSQLSGGPFNSFTRGISKHNHRHSRYQAILRSSAAARRNAAMNELLPSTPSGLVDYTMASKNSG